MIRTFVLVAATLVASSALADQQQAQECAGGLSPESKTIYEDVAPQVTPDTNLRDVITSTTKSLVMSGKIARSSAKTSAEAAGACLEKLKS